jgi:hypothetical protein
MLMSALSGGGGGTVPLRLGGDSLPSTLFSVRHERILFAQPYASKYRLPSDRFILFPSFLSKNPTSPARDGPHVPEPGSLEHVRQGLLTMHTILAANPLLDHREATAAADVVNAAAQAAAARLVSERDALARAATEAEATAEAATVVVEAAAAAATSATSAETSPETLPSLADGGSSSGDSALSEEGANASPEDADNEFFDPQTSFEENGYHDVSISTDAASAPTTAVTAASPRRRHERAGVPLFFVGQWVDCKDTVPKSPSPPSPSSLFQHHPHQPQKTSSPSPYRLTSGSSPLSWRLTRAFRATLLGQLPVVAAVVVVGGEEGRGWEAED